MLLILAALTALSTATIHHLFVGNLALPASIHALEFDDEQLTLVKVASLPADGSSPWINLSVSNLLHNITRQHPFHLQSHFKHPTHPTQHDKKNLYASQFSKPAIASYSILSSTSLRLDASIDSTGVCSNSTSAFVQSLSNPPYTVFTAAWPGPDGCGQSLSTYPNGTLKAVQQTWNYATDSGVHGMAFSPGEEVLYSADLNGDSVWTHSVGEDVKVLGRWNVTKSGMHPRHLVAHPGGGVVHVVTEAGNEVLEIEVDSTGLLLNESGHWNTIPDSKLQPGRF